MLKLSSVKILLVITITLLGSWLISAQEARPSATPLAAPTGPITPVPKPAIKSGTVIAGSEIKSSLQITNAEKIESTPTEKDVKKALANKEFKLALQTLEPDSKSIDLKSAKKTSSVEQPDSYEVLFPVMSGKTATGESLVYSLDGGVEFVYFMGVNTVKPSATARGIFGWSNWSLTGKTRCSSRFFCFGNSQRGTFVEEVRHRLNNSQIQNTRWVFVHCGC
jgi:hypothetical protein